MTISSSTRKAGPYTGNGVTTSFSFSFKVFAASELLVVRTALDGTESNLVLGTDYTVSLNANQNSNPGGSVTALTAPATGIKITITSAIANTQQLDLTNQGGFYPSVINDALDRATIQIQQLQLGVDRAVKTSISSTTTPDQLLDSINASVASASSSASSASSSATSASSSASAAASSATSAASSATSASSSATAAAASAATAGSAVASTVGAITGIVKGNGSGAISAATAGTDYVAPGTATNFTVPQRAATLTDNDLSFDLSAKQNFKCTPTAGGTLTFTNHADGLSGFIILVNGSNYAITAAATTKISATALARISATGTYRLDYASDGTNTYVTASESLA